MMSARASAGSASLPARARDRPPSWLSISTVVAARAALAVIGGLLLCSVLPVALGWPTSLVMSGSMRPRLQVGDIVVARPVAANLLTSGQVLLVRDPVHPGRLLLHRLVRRAADGQLVLRGDANARPDSTTVATGDVLGVAVLRIPLLGLPWARARDGHWPELVAFVVILLTLVTVGTRLHDSRR